MNVIVWNGLDLIGLGIGAICLVWLAWVILVDEFKRWWKKKCSTWNKKH